MFCLSRYFLDDLVPQAQWKWIFEFWGDSLQPHKNTVSWTKSKEWIRWERSVWVCMQQNQHLKGKWRKEMLTRKTSLCPISQHWRLKERPMRSQTCTSHCSRDFRLQVSVYNIGWGLESLTSLQQVSLPHCHILWDPKVKYQTFPRKHIDQLSNAFRTCGKLSQF